MNADNTVEQAESVLSDMGAVLERMNTTFGDFDGTLEHFGKTLTEMDASIAMVNSTGERLLGIVEQMEQIAVRVERLVTIAETLLAPVGATESAIRGLATSLRSRLP